MGRPVGLEAIGHATVEANHVSPEQLEERTRLRGVIALYGKSILTMKSGHGLGFPGVPYKIRTLRPEAVS